MSEQQQMLADTVTRLFREAGDMALAAERDGWQAALWQQVEELGIPLVLVPEADGGVGGDWEDLLAVMHPVGYYQVPLPVGEAMLAARLAASAGLALDAGAVTVAAQATGTLSGSGSDARFSGTLSAVPWGRDATQIVTVRKYDDGAQVLVLPRSAATAVREAANLAGEPRDTLVFESAAVQAAPSDSPEALALFDHCALLRVTQIVGALESALHRSIQYAGERKQFGRAIGKFQAVQQLLAQFGADVAAVSCAARAACRAATRGDAREFQIAAARLRANQAIGLATATAHQVHAAIGFTHEYGLRHATQRLWSWRSEFGNDRYWADRLGASVAARGADHFWSDLTARDDAAA